MAILRLWIGLAFAFLLPAAPALAANASVTATPASTFSPKHVFIDQGELVEWSNGGGFHNVRFDDGSFTSPAVPDSGPWQTSRSFPARGVFRYYCEAHGGPGGAGMAGTVSVSPQGFVRPQSANSFRASLSPAFRQCTAPNRTHGPPLASPSCNPPAEASDWITVGAGSSGSVALKVLIGNPSTPADDADVRVVTSITDVRNKAGGTDYTGELQMRLPLRITDRYNGPAQDELGTAEYVLQFTVPCTATGATQTGSTCSLTTTVDALQPGAVREGKRAVWQLFEARAYDGGADGLASTTGGNTLFATQALLAP